MSTQKGNSNRSRPQKYQNHTAFKNDLHDKTNKIKIINSLEVANVCEKCKKIIEWKIKYKKYKPLKAPGKCIKCEQKSVKHAYHNMCLPCAKQSNVCPKCNEKGEIIEGGPNKEESIKLDAELQALLKELPERKRRTFIRYMNRNATNKNNSKKNKNVRTNENNEEDDDKEQKEDKTEAESISRSDLLLKLKLLTTKEEENSDFTDDDVDSNLSV